ncbi:MAG: TldD/PmbA family protein [Thermoprotei archaeon]
MSKRSPIGFSESELEEIPASTLKMAGQGEDLVVLLERTRRKMIRASNGTITVLQSWDEAELGLFFRTKGSTAIGSTLDLTPSGISSSLERLRVAASLSRPKPSLAPLPGPSKYLPIDGSYDPDLLGSDRSLSEAVETASEAAIREGAERSAVVMNAEERSWYLASSFGASAKAKATSAHLVIRSFCGSGSAQSVTASPSLSGLNPADAGTRSGMEAREASSPVKGEAGIYDVVLGPSIFANLIGTLGASASAYAVQSGFSYLSNMLGKKVASEALSIYDNGRLEGGLLLRPFDDEGQPTQRTPIIEGGVLKNYLTNSQLSMEMGLPRTGNAGWIEPRPWNLEVGKGDASESDLTDGHVLYLTNTWYTRFQNYSTGEFSTIPRDAIFEFSSGKKVRAVKGLRLSGNMLEMLSSVEALGSQRTLVRWWEVEVPTLLPPVLVRGIRLTSAD